MVKYLKLMVVMMATLFATSAMAFTPPASPKPTGNIVDQTGTLTQDQLGRLNSQLSQINSNSANEIGVLVIRSLDGENIRDVGISTARAWGVGKKDLDNGVMIVWSPGDRKIGIETGKGVEGDLPDLKCNDIIRNVMGPQFRQKNFEAGLSQAFTAISSAIEDHRAAVAERDKRNAASPPSNAIAASGSTSPQTSTATRQSGGCDVSGAPMTQAGVGFSIFWLLLVGGSIWLFVRKQRTAAKRREQEELEYQARRREQRRQELERLNVLQETHAREEQARLQPIPVPIVIPVARPVVHDPVATATTTTATADVAARIRREQENERLREEKRQAVLQAQEKERRRQEREEAQEAAFAATLAAAAVASSSSSSDDDSGSSSSSDDDDDDDDDSSSSSDSSDSDFGGGDFGGGGSSDSY
jgi:uncharacterized membrane protein YgcG